MSLLSTNMAIRETKTCAYYLVSIVYTYQITGYAIQYKSLPVPIQDKLGGWVVTPSQWQKTDPLPLETEAMVIKWVGCQLCAFNMLTCIKKNKKHGRNSTSVQGSVVPGFRRLSRRTGIGCHLAYVPLVLTFGSVTAWCRHTCSMYLLYGTGSTGLLETERGTYCIIILHIFLLVVWLIQTCLQLINLSFCSKNALLKLFFRLCFCQKSVKTYHWNHTMYKQFPVHVNWILSKDFHSWSSQFISCCISQSSNQQTQNKC